MNRLFLSILICLFTFSFSLFSFISFSENVKKPVVAGMFYEKDKEALQKQVNEYLKLAGDVDVKGKIIGMVCPHAGYVYTRDAMGIGYKAIKDKPYKKVIILAISHSVPFQGLSVLEADAYETPLGKVPIDIELRDKLLKEKHFQNIPQASQSEHSAEVQLPYLQTVLKDFKVVIILVGYLNYNEYDEVAQILKKYIDDDTLVIASSDFTHYGESYGYVPFKKDIKENLHKLDGEAIDLITKLDFAGFQKFLDTKEATICGRAPISLLMKILEGKAEGKLLKYYTSGDLENDYTRSIGYASIVFIKKENPQEVKSEKKRALIEEKDLTQDEEKTLLKLSREVLTKFLEEGKRPEIDLKKYNLSDRLKEKRGVFVTLNEKGMLRGCIGYVEGIKPLYEGVIDNTINAASEDPRFPQVQKKELKDIEIEISAMTPLKKINSLDEIIVDKNGIVIRKGYRQGLLLPQVPMEWGWDKEQFLLNICRKAGLPDNAYKDKDAELYIFSAQVFNEEDYKEHK